MGVVTLQRRNALENRFAFRTLTTTSPIINPSPKSNNNSCPRRNRRRRCPKETTDLGSPSSSKKHFPSSSNQRLVMGEVRILKRGEVLVSPNNKHEEQPERKPTAVRRKRRNNNNNKDLTLCSTDRLGPEPETVCKQIKILDLYAGAVTDVPSPAPSDLPFPSRLVKCGAVVRCRDEGFAPTVDIRRLLRTWLIDWYMWWWWTVTADQVLNRRWLWIGPVKTTRNMATIWAWSYWGDDVANRSFYRSCTNSSIHRSVPSSFWV